MASKAAKAKNLRRQNEINHGKEFATRYRNRCAICGRPRGYNRVFKLCRICLRNKALAGEIPGLTKATW